MDKIYINGVLVDSLSGIADGDTVLVEHIHNGRKIGGISYIHLEPEPEPTEPTTNE